MSKSKVLRRPTTIRLGEESDKKTLKEIDWHFESLSAFVRKMIVEFKSKNLKSGPR